LGTLRINESVENTNDYRIVGRATGIQRIWLNSKIFREMQLEKVSEKRVRLTANCPDHTQPQVFLIHSTPPEIDNLHQKLQELLDKVKATQNGTTTAAADQPNGENKTPSTPQNELVV